MAVVEVKVPSVRTEKSAQISLIRLFSHTKIRNTPGRHMWVPMVEEKKRKNRCGCREKRKQQENLKVATFCLKCFEIERKKCFGVGLELSPRQTITENERGHNRRREIEQLAIGVPEQGCAFSFLTVDNHFDCDKWQTTTFLIPSWTK